MPYQEPTDYTGTTVGNLQIIEQVWTKVNKLRWLCICKVCTSKIFLMQSDLKVQWKIDSCGCLKLKRKEESKRKKEEYEKNKRIVGRPIIDIIGQRFNRLYRP